MKKILLSIAVLTLFACSGENNDKKEEGDSSNKDVQAILEIKGKDGITICDCMVGQEPDLNLATNKQEYDSLFELRKEHFNACMDLEKKIGRDGWISAQKECK